MSDTTTHTLDVPGAVLTYDVHEPQQPSDHRPLFIIGSPMAASGFAEQVPLFADRTVITYDPRGAERSTREPGSDLTFDVHADDVHRIAATVGRGPVDVLGSSGGAVVALAWATAHPGEIGTLVAHEPPLTRLLEDFDVLDAAYKDIVATYQDSGFGPAMAKFIRLVMVTGPLPADYVDQPAPDPAQFGLPTEDDGARDDLLLAGNLAMPAYEPDFELLQRSGSRIVPAVGANGAGEIPHRAGTALAALLGMEPVVFPGDHSGFMSSDWSPQNDPAEFGAALRSVLDA